ncbi:GNAT family N-acetyltransferase [Nocardioides sp.]|uniref:GNAT family N-acetyltransferase n=1 Tax=Nocardioides sp. TaxID=35761 RepID=UPI0027267056|nr:GNAT family N-acetyltransferase [Nocardioides sp.]MDO9458203.1 GNAT family N-acetyltransferase [Nocardioides sp.]
MTRRIVRLTPDRLTALGESGVPCRSCVRWELDPVRRGRLGSTEEAAAEKDAWLSWVLREWGSCGRVATVDDVAVGYVVYAPPAFVPGSDAYPTAPVSSDAVLLTAAYVAPEHAGGGIGRMLVQAMARDLVERGGIRAVEAFGDTRSRGRCVVSVDFLAHVGFRTHRAHPTTPRMRMDLRSALSWKDEVEAAIERLVGAVRPTPAPRPSLRDGTVPREAADPS